MKKIIFLLSLAAASNAASDTNIYLHLASKHLIKGSFNERNLGLGVQYDFGGTVAAAGTFRNSYYRQSAYVGAGWRWSFARHVNFTMLIGGATGYKNLTGGFLVLPVIVPQLDVGHFSVAVLGTAVTASLRF